MNLTAGRLADLCNEHNLQIVTTTKSGRTKTETFVVSKKTGAGQESLGALFVHKVGDATYIAASRYGKSKYKHKNVKSPEDGILHVIGMEVEEAAEQYPIPPVLISMLDIEISGDQLEETAPSYRTSTLTLCGVDFALEAFLVDENGLPHRLLETRQRNRLAEITDVVYFMDTPATCKFEGLEGRWFVFLAPVVQPKDA